MQRHTLLLVAFLACLCLLPSLLTFVDATKEDVAAEAARKRAEKDPEELAREIAENTVIDADLLPTEPPAKNYVPTGKPEFGLLLTPGKGKSCNLKKYPNLIQFLKDEAWYYPELKVEYVVASDPKLKFFATKEQRDNGIIHGELLTEDDILQLLAAGPNESKEPIFHMPITEHTDVAELKYILDQHKVARAEKEDENHTARLIFKDGFVPVTDY